jgi:hypothetical protein
MNYSHLDEKTLFLHGPATIYDDKEPTTPTIGNTKRFGRLKVSGKAVRLEPVDDDSGWWIGFKPGEPEKFRQNNDGEEFTYLGKQVVPDFLHNVLP